jgi:hypothetical protein
VDEERFSAAARRLDRAEYFYIQRGLRLSSRCRRRWLLGQDPGVQRVLMEKSFPAQARVGMSVQAIGKERIDYALPSRPVFQSFLNGGL